VLHDIPHAEESQRRINDLLHSVHGSTDEGV
jgi:hypothetical protein